MRGRGLRCAFSHSQWALRDAAARFPVPLSAFADLIDGVEMDVRGQTYPTFEALEALIEKGLPGFGEIFRALSYRQVGPAAILSRALAGTYRGMLVFSMPGSEKAVRLAVRRLILPELPHMAGLLEKAGG